MTTTTLASPPVFIPGQRRPAEDVPGLPDTSAASTTPAPAAVPAADLVDDLTGAQAPAATPATPTTPLPRTTAERRAYALRVAADGAYEMCRDVAAWQVTRAARNGASR